MTNADRLRAEAARHEADVDASRERSDTDGFVSQWASGMNAQLKRRQADLVEAGGVATFARCELRDLDDNPVAAKLINGRYGKCWALLDDSGSFTGDFVSAHPARESTMARKGYREAWVEFVAEAKVIHWGRGRGLSGATNVQVIVVPTDPSLKFDRIVGLGDFSDVPA